MVWAVAFIFLFLIGGLTGIPLAIASLDLTFQDTWFVTAHFHYVMAVSGTFAIFGGIYYLMPKMSGKMYNQALATVGFWLSFIGVNVTFMTMFISGLEGYPRRYYDYEQFSWLQDQNQIMTYGTYMIALGSAIIIIDWILTPIMGKPCGGNPWGSKSLEWHTAETPPPHGNWGPELPKIAPDWHPHDYKK